MNKTDPDDHHHKHSEPEEEEAPSSPFPLPSSLNEDLSALREYVDHAIHQITLSVQGHMGMVAARLSGIEPQIRRAQADSNTRWTNANAEIQTSLGTALSQLASTQSQLSESLTRLSGRTDRLENQWETTRNEISQEHGALTARCNDEGIALGEELTRIHTRLAEMEDAVLSLETHLSTAQEELDAERKRHSSLEATWNHSPLSMRLTFLKNLLPREHSAARALTSALDALAEMTDQDQFAVRFTSFPQRTADTLSPFLLMADNAKDLSSLTQLCLSTLDDFRKVLESVSGSLGIELIIPRPGDPMDNQCQLSGSPPQIAGDAPIITKVKRVGFRRNGALLLPALVSIDEQAEDEVPTVPRSSNRRENSSADPASPAADMPDSNALPSADGEHPKGSPVADMDVLLPIFLRKMARVAEADGNEMAIREMTALRTAAEFLVTSAHPSVEDLKQQIELLLPIFSTAKRDIPESWLHCISDNWDQIKDFLLTYGIEMILPGTMVALDSRTMTSNETVPTLYEKNIGQIARLNRVGFCYGAEVLFPALVASYVKDIR